MSTQLERFLSRLEGIGVSRNGEEFMALCAAHEDRKPRRPPAGEKSAIDDLTLSASGR